MYNNFLFYDAFSTPQNSRLRAANRTRLRLDASDHTVPMEEV